MKTKLDIYEFLTEFNNNSGARIWWYRMNSEPLVKKKLIFRDNYSKARVREYLVKELGITYPITLWPAFLPEPPIK